MNTTLWKSVSGYEGVYEVSNAGRVRRIGKCRGSTAGRVLTLKFWNGYSHADLSVGDKKKRHLVHRLVATAFLGPPPHPKCTVNHKNFKRSDNRPENLEWISQLENVRHAMLHGRIGGQSMPGERNPRAKLKWQQVEEIRALRGVVGSRGLAVRYGVSRSTIRWIHQGKHWK